MSGVFRRPPHPSLRRRRWTAPSRPITAKTGSDSGTLTEASSLNTGGLEGITFDTSAGGSVTFDGTVSNPVGFPTTIGYICIPGSAYTESQSETVLDVQQADGTHIFGVNHVAGHNVELQDAGFVPSASSNLVDPAYNPFPLPGHLTFVMVVMIDQGGGFYLPYTYCYDFTDSVWIVDGENDVNGPNDTGYAPSSTPDIGKFIWGNTMAGVTTQQKLLIGAAWNRYTTATEVHTLVSDWSLASWETLDAAHLMSGTRFKGNPETDFSGNFTETDRTGASAVFNAFGAFDDTPVGGGGDQNLTGSNSATLSEASRVDQTRTDSAALSEASRIDQARADAGTVTKGTSASTAAAAAADSAAVTEASKVEQTRTDTAGLAEASQVDSSTTGAEGTLTEASRIDIATTDSAAVSDGSTVSTGTDKVGTDPGTVADTSAPAASVAATDSATLGETSRIDLSRTDTGTVTDSSSVGQGTTDKTAADTAAVTDASAPAAAVTAADQASVSEGAGATTGAIAANDQGALGENAQVGTDTSKVASDTIGVSEASSVTAATGATDGGTGSDGATSRAGTDAATVGEHSSVDTGALPKAGADAGVLGEQADITTVPPVLLLPLAFDSLEAPTFLELVA